MLGGSPLLLSLSCRVWPGQLWQPVQLSSFVWKDTAGNIGAQGFSFDCHEESLVHSSRPQDSESAPEGMKYK